MVISMVRWDSTASTKKEITIYETREPVQCLGVIITKKATKFSN